MNKVAIGNVVKIERVPATEEECRNLPYVGLEHIEKEAGQFAAGYEPTAQPMLATNFRFTPRHVLYGKLRPYLNKVVLPDFDGVCTTEILPLLPQEDRLNRVYLWAMLMSPAFVKWASANVSGANLPRLSPSLLAEYPIPLPPLAEQQRIADILSRADRLRRLRRFALEMSEGYLQAVFLEMFGDLLQTRQWKTSKLEKLADVVSGVTKGQRFNGRPTVEVPYLRVANVQDGYLDLSEIKTIEALPSDVAKYQLRQGDILMTEGGDFDKLGRGAIWEEQIANCIHQNHIFRVRLDQEMVLPRFFGTLLMMRYTKAYFLRASKQTTNLATINMGQLKAFEVPVPPMEMQQQFVAVSVKYDRLRAQQREALRQAEHLFQALLQGAFRGELTPDLVSNTEERIMNNRAATENVAKYIKVAFEEFSFKPDSIPFQYEKTFGHSRGNFVSDGIGFDKLIQRLTVLYPNIARRTLESYCNQMLLELIDIFAEGYRSDWENPFMLGEVTPPVIANSQIESAANDLQKNLAGLVRECVVFVPIMGINLEVPKYEFGPVTLMRTNDSLPVLDQADASAEFKYVHPDIMGKFEEVPCHVEVQVSGDTEYARQEGLRLANQMAAILNLHFAHWFFTDKTHAKIQCVGIPSLSVRVILVRTDLPDESGGWKPTYLHGTNTYGVIKHSLTITQLNAVKKSGFDSIWACFENSGKTNERCQRIRRAILWYDRSVNFAEVDV